MTKASNLKAAADIAGVITADLIANDSAKASKKAKATKAPAAAKVETESAAVSVRELAVIKAVAESDFAEPESKAVPSYLVALACEASVPPGPGKTNSPVPGIIASLGKKGFVETFKLAGQTLVGLTASGREVLALTV